MLINVDNNPSSNVPPHARDRHSQCVLQWRTSAAGIAAR